MIYAHTTTYAEEESAQVVLPEPLGHEAVKLIIADAVVALVLVALCAFFDLARGAWLTVVTIALLAAAFGRYRGSMAATPRDEWYSTMTITLVTVLVMFALVPLFAVSPLAVSLVLIGWTIGGSLAASTLTAQRRGSHPLAICAAPFLTPAMRKRARSGVVRTIIATLDVVLAVVVGIVLLPVFAAVAIAIAADGDGAILFQQERIGVDGRTFTMLKFRTMRPDAGSAWATDNDDRITRIGAFLRRTSLDELPQLWNVLRGEMSLVGPRPEMTEYADRFVKILPAYEDRHAVPPGITGWAQVQYDRNFPPSDVERVLPYDLFYVAHYSVALYLYTLIKTAFEVFRHRAI